MMIYPGFAALVEWYVAGRLRWKPLIPLGIIVVALGYMTVRAQEVAIDANIPALTRLINGVVAYGEYLMKTLYPAKLSIFYPYGVNLFHWKIAVGFLLLGSSLTLLFYTLKRAPVCALAIGWLICGLVPVIGFIHVGIASHADRYTYLSTMGLSVALAVFLRSMTRAGRGWLFALVTLPLAIYALVAALYIQAWQNNYTIFHHAIESCPENAKAWQQLGAEYANRFKNPDEGIACYRRALAILASDECGSQLASALAIRGKPGDFEEVKRLTLGVAQNPELDETGGALLGLGIVAMREQRWQDAVKYLTLSEKRKTSPSVCLWLGMSLYQTGRIQEAAKLFKEVSEDAPEACDREEGRKRLAYVLQKYGNLLK
jgi:tetratricopeptide (TPR) repeat protein